MIIRTNDWTCSPKRESSHNRITLYPLGTEILFFPVGQLNRILHNVAFTTHYNVITPYVGFHLRTYNGNNTIICSYVITPYIFIIYLTNSYCPTAGGRPPYSFSISLSLKLFGFNLYRRSQARPAIYAWVNHDVSCRFTHPLGLQPIGVIGYLTCGRYELYSTI